MEQCEQLTKIVKYFDKLDQTFCLSNINDQLNLNLDEYSFAVLMNILLQKGHIEKRSYLKTDGQYYRVVSKGSVYINQTDYCLELRSDKNKQSTEKAKSAINIFSLIFGIIGVIATIYFSLQEHQNKQELEEKELQIKVLQQKIDSLERMIML